MFRSAFPAPFSNPFPQDAIPLVYLLRSEFTTPVAAPIPSPYTCEPGPGTLTIVDTGNNLAIVGGKLTSIGYVSAIDPRSSTPTFTRTVGLSAAWNIYPSGFCQMQIVFDTQNIHTLSSNRPTVSVVNAELGLTVNLNASNVGLMIARTDGAFFVYNGKLGWVSVSGNGNPTIRYSGYISYTFPYSAEYIRVFQLSTPFDTDYGIATARIASHAANAEITSEANALVEDTWTAVTGETWELSTRRTDDDNRWIVRGSQGGSTVKLIQRQAGVETERSSAAQTWTNGTTYRLVVIQDGNTIRTFVNNVAKNTYASAAFNNTATNVKTDKAGTNLIAWPRTLSGAALAELNRWTA